MRKLYNPSKAPVLPAPGPSHTRQPDGYKVGTRSSFAITDDDMNQRPANVLDLQQMADRFAEKNKVYDQERICELRKCEYRDMTLEEFEVMKKNDKFLKELYEVYHDPLMKNIRTGLRHDMRDIIHRLEQSPHLYSPYKREGRTVDFVNHWLQSSTDNPQPELVGFTSKCPLEPRRFISTVEPRLSSSAIAIHSSKRKICDVVEDDVTSVMKSNSDSRLVCEKYGRTCLSAKRRKRVQ